MLMFSDHLNFSMSHYLSIVLSLLLYLLAVNLLLLKSFGGLGLGSNRMACLLGIIGSLSGFMRCRLVIEFSFITLA